MACGLYSMGSGRPALEGRRGWATCRLDVVNGSEDKKMKRRG